MRYPPDQKAKAKEAILQAGAKALRTNGFKGIGVDGLAASAGVTSGAFYSNFSSKEELLKDVIEAYLGNPFIDVDDGSPAERRQRLKDYLRMYISPHHRGDPAYGCVMPTLSADVSRSDSAVRDVYRQRMAGLIEKMSRVLGDESQEPERHEPAGPKNEKEETEKKAWTILAMMVGAVLVAQALPDGGEANKVLEAALESAISLVETAPG
jgi:TetR/AcrR family transcriptional regulator, transcriptional repressor for nem operon